jgi:hypothetical protein
VEYVWILLDDDDDDECPNFETRSRVDRECGTWPIGPVKGIRPQRTKVLQVIRVTFWNTSLGLEAVTQD